MVSSALHVSTGATAATAAVRAGLGAHAEEHEDEDEDEGEDDFAEADDDAPPSSSSSLSSNSAGELSSTRMELVEESVGARGSVETSASDGFRQSSSWPSCRVMVSTEISDAEEEAEGGALAGDAGVWRSEGTCCLGDC